MATSWTILNLSFFMPLPVDLKWNKPTQHEPAAAAWPSPRFPLTPGTSVEVKRPRLYPSIGPLKADLAGWAVSPPWG